MRMLLLGCLGALLSVAAPAGSAVAQSDSVVLSGSEIGVMTTSQAQERVAQLEKDYNSVNLAAPRAGVGVSAILVPGGALMLTTGIALRNFEATFFCPADMPRCGDPSPGGAAMAALGAAALVGGLVGVFMASGTLKKRKKERRRIEVKIATLKHTLPPE